MYASRHSEVVNTFPAKNCLCSSMDRIQPSEGCDAGSTPTRGTMKKVQSSQPKTDQPRAEKFKVQSSVNFLFEASTLKRLQRTGWQILGENRESIAEHSYMVCVISFILASEAKVDMEKVLLISLFHDFIESRIGDIYKLADLYMRADVMKAAKDSFSNLTESGKMIRLFVDYEEEKTLESLIVHDADTLSLIIELKQMMERGNSNAKVWLDANLERLKLDQSKRIGKMIKSGNSQDWWKNERKKLHKGYKK